MKERKGERGEQGTGRTRDWELGEERRRRGGRRGEKDGWEGGRRIVRREGGERWLGGREGKGG